MLDSLAQSFEVDVAGRQLFFDRSLELLRRFESAIGAIRPFAERLERGNVTSTEVARAYETLVRDDPDAPTRAQIDEWVFIKGLLTHQRLAVFMYSLCVGSEALAREAARLAALQIQSGKAAEGGRSPFAKTA